MFPRPARPSRSTATGWSCCSAARFSKKSFCTGTPPASAKWLETSVQIRSRAITYRLFKPVDLSIVLSSYNMADAEKFLSRRIRVVNNGIPDPCPDFAATILPRRRARLAARIKLFAGETLSPRETVVDGADPETIKVLFLAHWTREKGLVRRHARCRGGQPEIRGEPAESADEANFCR